MSKYTTEVRFICETAAGLSESVGFSDVESVLEKSWDKIFSPYIPFYKEEKRSELCQKILAHYYTREIGFETVGLWKLNLNRKMNEIMPYYNEIYKTLDLEYSPLQDVDYFEHHENKDTFQETTLGTTSRESTNTGTTKDTRTNDLSEITSHSSESTGSTTVSSTDKNTDSTTVSSTVSTTGKTTDSANGSTTNKTIKSDTPQNDLTDFEAEQYLTSAEKTTGSSTQTGNGTSEGESVTSGTTSVTGSTEGNETGTSSGTTTESGTRANTGTVTDEGTRSETGSETGSNSGKRDNNGTGTGDVHVWGKRGGQSYAAAIKEYREQILNVDMMVIEELSDLFMRLW